MVYEMTNFTFKKYPNTILVLVVTITLTFSLSSCHGFLQNVKDAFPVGGTENQKKIIAHNFWAQFYDETTTQVVSNDIPIESVPLDSLDTSNELDSNLYSDQQGELHTPETQLADLQTNQVALTCPEGTSEVSCNPTNQTLQSELQSSDTNFEYSGGEIVHEDPDTTVKPLIITEDSDSFLEESTVVEPEVLTEETASAINVLPQPKDISVEENSESTQEPSTEPTERINATPTEEVVDQNLIENSKDNNQKTDPISNESENVQTALVQPQKTTKLFRWPVTGRTIKEFGGQNEGINLAVPEGTPVKAAEDGRVVYSDEDLVDFGKLVIIRHDNGWISAYAHNEELLVKRDEIVRRGDEIAKAGATGNLAEFPQLHFMLRNSENIPVNPLEYLPKQ